jgi:L-amino acid N-acyltransferase YncA
MMKTIRKAKVKDRMNIWKIFQQVIQSGDTYAYPPDTPFPAFKKFWFAKNQKCFVMMDGNEVIGSYVLRDNQPGLGSHIANASYIVNPAHQGKGIGQKLCAHSIMEAKRAAYLGIQFNIVVSTNKAAVNLWAKMGFEIIGTVPNGFKHQQLGYVDTYIMYRKL